MSKLTQEQALSLAQSISDSTYKDLISNFDGEIPEDLQLEICKISSRAAAIAICKLLDYLQMIHE